jgi:hypothetical protein
MITMIGVRFVKRLLIHKSRCDMLVGSMYPGVLFGLDISIRVEEVAVMRSSSIAQSPT